MRSTPTILAIIRKQLKIKIVDKRDSIALQINRIFKTRITTAKSHVDLLKEMSAIEIFNNRFYAEAKVKLKVNSKIENIPMNRILNHQSTMLRDMIDEKKHLAKEIAMKKMKQRFDEIT